MLIYINAGGLIASSEWKRSVREARCRSSWQVCNARTRQKKAPSQLGEWLGAQTLFLSPRGAHARHDAIVGILFACLLTQIKDRPHSARRVALGIRRQCCVARKAASEEHVAINNVFAIVPRQIE